jgi:GrpB-like predicted nucleotidyltransferase (UPF0157 family)
MLDGDRLGLRENRVRVVPHDPDWPLLGRNLCRQLREAAGDHALDVAHVGSTAVPGLEAKPILDLALGTPTDALDPTLSEILHDLGYRFVADTGAAGGHLFALRTAPDVSVVHVHVVAYGGAQWHNYLVFRDVLRGDPQVRRTYAEVKRRLGERYPEDRAAYTAGKHDFVRWVLEGRGGVAQ